MHCVTDDEGGWTLRGRCPLGDLGARLGSNWITGANALNGALMCMGVTALRVSKWLHFTYGRRSNVASLLCPLPRIDQRRLSDRDGRRADSLHGGTPPVPSTAEAEADAVDLSTLAEYGQVRCR